MENGDLVEEGLTLGFRVLEDLILERKEKERQAMKSQPESLINEAYMWLIINGY